MNSNRAKARQIQETKNLADLVAENNRILLLVCEKLAIQTGEAKPEAEQASPKPEGKPKPTK